MMKKLLVIGCLTLFLLIGGGQVFAAVSTQITPLAKHPIEALVGEQLSYDVSFLWFDRLAIGTIKLTRGEQPGTYVALLEARTRGFAAFVTENRIERYQTVMEIGPDGFLRPLIFSSHTLRGEGENQREMESSYSFDFEQRLVKFQKIKNHVIKADKVLPLETDGQVFDILSAFYNLRLGSFGSFDQGKIHLPTFHRKGIEEIVVAPVKISNEEKGFFAGGNTLCKVLLDPEIFQTNGRDLLISFDENNRPQKAVVKNVIGLGDVKGVLRRAVNPVAQVD